MIQQRKSDGYEGTEGIPSDTLLSNLEFGVFWGSSLFLNTTPKEFLISNFLRERDAIFITAPAGIGKSILCLQMIAALTSGTSFLGDFRVARACNVLYVQTEGDRVETIERIRAMEEGVVFNHSKWVHININGLALNTDEGFVEFREMLRAPNIDYDVIIIDPLYTTLKGSINSDEVATDWIRNMRKLSKDYNCAFVIMHHDSIKSFVVNGVQMAKPTKDLMGTSVWSWFTSYNFKLYKRGDIHILERGKERGRDIIDVIPLKMMEPSPLMYVIAEDNFTECEGRVVDMLRGAGSSVYARDIIQSTEISKAQVYRILTKLHGMGIISKEGNKHNTKFSYIKEEEREKREEGDGSEGEEANT